MAVPHKSPMATGQFGPRNLQSPLTLFRPSALTSFRKMSSSCSQYITFPSTDANSEFFWTDGPFSSAFSEETFPFFQAGPTIDNSQSFPTNQLLPSFEEDHLRPPLAQSGDGERVGTSDFGLNLFTMSHNILPGDLYAVFSLFTYPLVPTTDCSRFDHVHQAAYRELFSDDLNTCSLRDIMGVCEAPLQAPVTELINTLPIAPVDPSTTTIYVPSFDYTPQVSPSDSASSASPPPTSPSVSVCSLDSSESDGDGDYASLSDGEYHPTSYQKKGKTASKSRSSRSSSTDSTSSESERSDTSRSRRRSHPYRRSTPSRNIQCEGTGPFVEKGSLFECPVPGCEYIQDNHRVPDLKRHIETHDRWRRPDRWICCGVETDVAHLYREGITQGMSDEEYTKAGAYLFRGRLMVGGCMKTFSRRDALKRHVDNPNIPCVGNMDTYRS